MEFLKSGYATNASNLFCLSSFNTSYDSLGILLTNLSRSMLLGDNTITSWPLPAKLRIAGSVVPSPSRLLIINTGEPLLILDVIAFVTAWRGIEPEAETAARLLKILKFCFKFKTTSSDCHVRNNSMHT